MNEITIEKGIPIPLAKYPFYRMEVGDSFFTPDERVAVTGNTTYATKKLGFKFHCQKWEEKGIAGTRCWRTE
jgi:hypothetical protein